MKGIFFSSYLIKFPVDAKEDKQLKSTSEIKKGQIAVCTQRGTTYSQSCNFYRQTTLQVSDVKKYK